MRSIGVTSLPIVIPAKAGIQGHMLRPHGLPWIPAFAGMTVERESRAGSTIHEFARAVSDRLRQCSFPMHSHPTNTPVFSVTSVPPW